MTTRSSPIGAPAPPGTNGAANGARPRSRVESVARDTAKRALRGVGMATGDLRPHPDFLIIGAKRGGTTSLWRYLCEVNVRYRSLALVHTLVRVLMR